MEASVDSGEGIVKMTRQISSISELAKHTNQNSPRLVDPKKDKIKTPKSSKKVFKGFKKLVKKFVEENKPPQEHGARRRFRGGQQGRFS